MYDKLACRWLSIDPVVHPYESPFVAFANNPIYYTDPTGTTEYPTSGDYKKANPEGKGDGSDGHWLTSDRNASNEVWKKANEVNLGKANGYVNYETIGQRADFYKWFQSHTESKGFETKWAGAAYKVASDIKNLESFASFGLVDYSLFDFTNPFSFTNTKMSAEIVAFANKGNRMIFEEVFPKLQSLTSGAPLKGADAQKWDGQALAEEQSLIQPLYSDFLSATTLWRIEHLSKGGGIQLGNNSIPNAVSALMSLFRNTTTSFPLNHQLINVNHRWAYGMQNMGYNVQLNAMPNVSGYYVNNKAYLHYYYPKQGYSGSSIYSKEVK